MSQLEKVHLLTSFPYAPHLVNPLCLRGGLSGVSHAIHMEESDLKKVFRKPFVQVSWVTREKVAKLHKKEEDPWDG